MDAIPHPMARAWLLYRQHAKSGPFRPALFKHLLSHAWGLHQGDLRRAAYAAERAAMPPTERRISAIEGEIERLEYASFRIDIAARRSELQAEMAALTETTNQLRAA